MTINLFSDTWAQNREKMLIAVESIVKNRPESLPFDTHLHLGCGPHILSGFHNIDKFQVQDGIKNEDMAELPSYVSNSIATIYSSHSLEHLPIRKAKQALRRWAAVLKTGGKLYLAVPDLLEICRCMLSSEINDYLKWHWFNYTLFGYQAPAGKENANDLNAPDDPGQYHQTGFSKEFLNQELQALGLSIVESYSYNGWDTPSIWIEAEKI